MSTLGYMASFIQIQSGTQSCVDLKKSTIIYEIDHLEVPNKYHEHHTLNFVNRMLLSILGYVASFISYKSRQVLKAVLIRKISNYVGNPPHRGLK